MCLTLLHVDLRARRVAEREATTTVARQSWKKKLDRK
jgi:hypothetical protein